MKDKRKLKLLFCCPDLNLTNQETTHAFSPLDVFFYFSRWQLKKLSIELKKNRRRRNKRNKQRCLYRVVEKETQNIKHQTKGQDVLIKK
jgi:hypothetical protein